MPHDVTANAEETLADLCALVERPYEQGEVTMVGEDPVLPSNYLLGTAGAATIAAAGLAATDLWELRMGRRQRVSVDIRAAGAAVRSDRYLHVNGKLTSRKWDPLSGFYRTRDARWIQFHCNFPHHRDAMLAVLACKAGRAEVTGAAERWGGERLEERMAQAGACAGLVRSSNEWRRHAHARAVGPLPVLTIEQIGESSPEPLPAGARPLTGIRTLDLTRVIAGPVAGRTLAEHGAQVMRVSAPHLPSVPDLVMDTGHGKLSTALDLNKARDATLLTKLLQRADILIQSYRPGALSRHGLSPEEVASLRPGIIYTSLSAYGHRGPWQNRRGFDTLVQSITGMVHEESGSGAPRHIAAQILDYCSGYLMAFGTMIALARRAREGGSYLVRASLCQTAHWIDGLGRLPIGVDGRSRPDLEAQELEDLYIESETPFGRLKHIAPVVRMSETEPRWTLPSVPLGTHAPVWPD